MFSSFVERPKPERFVDIKELTYIWTIETAQTRQSKVGPQFCAGFGNGLLLGYLMYRSGLVPRRMALLSLVGGPLAFIGGVLVLFDVLKPMSAGLFALTVLEIAGELSITIYPMVKGFRPSPMLEGNNQGRAITAD